jgi:hypothetical protein
MAEDPHISLSKDPADITEKSKATGSALHGTPSNEGTLVNGKPPWKVAEDLVNKGMSAADANKFVELIKEAFAAKLQTST